MMRYEIAIIVLSCAFAALLIGIVIYCYRRSLRNMCGRALHRKKRVHEITAPVRPDGENEIVLAVTQRREHVLPSSHQNIPAPVNNQRVTSLTRHNTVVGSGDGTYYQRHIQRHHPPYLISRHQSFNLYNTGRRGLLHGSGSDLPSPFVSNLSSLQSLLMSSQVAIFDSSTERLSLSSQNNINPNNGNINNQQQSHQQPITAPLLRQLQLRQSNSRAEVASSSQSPLPNQSNVHHAPQPSYFDERPPSYSQSVLIQKLRASDRGYNQRVAANRGDLNRRSFRM